MTIEIILAYIYHYLQFLLPYALTISAIFLAGVPGYIIGKFWERHEWKRDIKNGNRLGELAQEQLKKRDSRIRQLTGALKYREDQIERVGVKHRRMIGLSQEILNVAISEDMEMLRRRKRAG